MNGLSVVNKIIVLMPTDGEGITINVDQFVANEAFPGTHGSSNHLSGGITVPCFVSIALYGQQSVASLLST